jgi:amino acid transporter
MTKLLFLTVWYCSIYPAAFFMCSLSLLIKYFVDRFSLMRTWKRAPQLGTRVSKFSRRYFFSLACVAMAIMSSFYWSGFPFDNICENGDIDPAYIGNFTVYPLCKEDEECNGKNVSFSESDADYRFCSQDLLTPGRGRTFPFTARNQPEGDEWMTDDQEILTTVFGWSSVIITAFVIIKFIWGWVDIAQSLFHSDYKVRDRQKTSSVYEWLNVLGLMLSLSTLCIRLLEPTRTFLSARSIPETDISHR